MTEEINSESTPEEVKPSPAERRRNLYNKLHEAEFYTKSEEEFNEAFSDPKRRKNLYTKLNEGEFYTKSEDEFNSSFFADLDEPVKKKDEFGSVSEELAENFGKNSTVLPEVNIKPLTPLQEQGPDVSGDLYGKSYKPGFGPDNNPLNTNLPRGLDFQVPAKDKSAWEKFKSDPSGYAETTGNSFMKGLLGAVPATLQTVAAGANWLDENTKTQQLDQVLGLKGEPQDKEVRDYATYKAAEYLQRQIDYLFPTNASYGEDLIPQISGGLGFIAQLALSAENPKNITSAIDVAKKIPTIAEKLGAKAAGLFGAGLKTTIKSKPAQLAGTVMNAAFSRTGVLGAIQTGAGEFQAAKAAGATDDQAFEVATKNAIVGSGLEALPVMAALKRFNIGTDGTLLRVMGNAAVEGLEELAAETTQQLFANYTAKQVYDKTRELSEGVKESGEVAYITGALLNGMLGAIGMKRRNAKSPEERAQLLEAEAYLRKQLDEQQAINTINAERSKPETEPIPEGKRTTKDTENTIQISSDGKIMRRRADDVKTNIQKIRAKTQAMDPSPAPFVATEQDQEYYPTPDQLDETRATIATENDIDPQVDFEGELHQTNPIQYMNESVGRVLDALDGDGYVDNDDLLAAEKWAFKAGSETSKNQALAPEEKVSTLKIISNFLRDIHARVDEEVSKVDANGEPIVNNRDLINQVEEMRTGKTPVGKLKTDAYGDPVKPKPGKVNEPNPHIAEIAKKYAPDTEVDDTLVEKLDVDNSKAIADAYESMEHNPEDPETKAAYQAMKDETKKQWDALTAEGYVFEPWEGEGEPYASSADMARDLKENKHLWFFQTEKGFGESDETFNSNPLTEPSGVEVNGKNLLYNDLFRAVHDAFGHGKLGNQFGAVGEENAWRTHVQMYSPAARRAVTTETRGQNSWVNFGPHMRNADGTIKKKGDEGFMGVRERPFADQKVGLLPEEFSSLDGKKSEPVKPKTTTKTAVVKPKPVTETKTFLTPDEQIAQGKERLKNLFGKGAMGAARDIASIPAEVVLALGEMAVGYARKGVNTAKEFVIRFKADIPNSGISDEDLEQIFNDNLPKAQKYPAPLKTGEGTSEHKGASRLDPKKSEIDKAIMDAGLDFNSVTTSEVVEGAQEIIKERGLEEAYKILFLPDASMTETQRGMLGVQVMAELIKQYNATGDQQYVDMAADVEPFTLSVFSDNARVLATAAKVLAQMRGVNPKTAKAYARRQAAKERDAALKAAGLKDEVEKLRKENKELLKKAAEAAVEKITPAVLVPEPPKEKKRISFSEKSRKSISDWFDTFKVPTGKTAPLSSFLLPPTILNAGVDVIKKAVLMGFDVASAVSKGIAYIKSQHNTAWDEAGFEAAITAHANQAKVQTPAIQVAERVLNHVAPAGAKIPDPVQRMVNLLFNKAKQHLPKQQQNKPLTALEQIVFMLENYDIFRDQLQQAQVEVMDWVSKNGTPAMADQVSEFVMAMTKFPVAENLVTKVTKGLIESDPKKLRGAIRDLAASHYTNKEETRDTLAMKLVKQLGLDPAQANLLAETIKKNFDALMAKEQAKFLAEKTKLKNSTPRQKKYFIDKLIEAANMGALPDDKFRDIFAEAHNIPVLTDQQWQQLDDLTDRIQELKKVLDADKNNPTPATAAAAKKAHNELLKAYRDVVDIKEHAPGAGEVFVNRIRLSTLGIQTIGINIFGNVTSMPVWLTKFVVETALDKIAAGLDKNHVRTTAGRESVKGAAESVWPALKETFFHLVHGTATDKITGGHRNPGIRKGYRNMMNPKLTVGQRFGGLLEMTGAPFDKLIAKGLLMGDHPIKRIAEGVEARRIAAIKGLKGQDLKTFLKYPDPVSAELIKYAGESAVFQNKSAKPDEVTGKISPDGITDHVVDVLGKFGDKAESSVEKAAGPFAGALARVMVSPFALYIRIPVNLARLTVSYAFPEVHAGLALGWLAAGNRKKGIHHASKAITGYAIHGVAAALIAAGAMTGDDEEDSEKERSGAKAHIGPNRLNLSILMDPVRMASLMWNTLPGTENEPIASLPGDTWMDYSRIPVLGPIFSAKASSMKSGDAVDDKLMEMRKVGAGLMDQGIFMGTLGLVEALKDTKGSKLNRFVVSTVETLTNPFAPKVIKEASKASDDYTRETRGNINQMLKAMVIERLKIVMDENQLAVKLDPFGRPVSKPAIFKDPSEDDILYKLTEAAVHSGNSDYLPPAVQKKQTFGRGKRAVEIELDPYQYEAFMKILGEERLDQLGEEPETLKPDKIAKKYKKAMKRAKKRFAKTLE